MEKRSFYFDGCEHTINSSRRVRGPSGPVSHARYRDSGARIVGKNGLALCPKCNLKANNGYISPSKRFFI